jgi:A/G-specific adenine glycosylase
VHKYIAFELTNIILINNFYSLTNILLQNCFKLDEFRKALTVWYNQTKRELPWRESRDPYKIWVSEVILQQTRVQQGMDYYHNFLQNFPDVRSLALADEEEVLKVWQGLGYYSRARNMHHAAKTILLVHGGTFPEDYLSIRNLKGIGDYTAAAISSIAFGLPYAVVDGNVFRVLSRLFGIPTPIDTNIGKKEFYHLAQLMLDIEHPGEFNQALMEFGAIQCLPNQPICLSCPLVMKCHAYITRTVAAYPVKTKKTRQKERYLNYLYIHNKEQLFLEKRVDKDIWRYMFQFPLIETTGPTSSEDIIYSISWKEILKSLNFSIESISPERIHILTHQRLHLRFFSISLNDNQIPNKLITVQKTNILRYPVPKPVENFLLEMGY